jgi:hypothetical protein
MPLLPTLSIASKIIPTLAGVLLCRGGLITDSTSAPPVPSWPWSYSNDWGCRRDAGRNVGLRSRVRVFDRTRGNVEALVSEFAGYVLRFEASNTFSGPSV